MCRNPSASTLPAVLAHTLIVGLIVGLIAGLTMLFPQTAIGQPMANPGDKTRATQLKLKEIRDEPGRWARAQGRLPKDGRRYYLSGLNVMAPLSIQVIGHETDDVIEVRLHRHVWGEAAASGDTSDGGVFAFEGRAHGDVGITLKPADGEPTRFTLIAWQGEPLPPDFSSVYVPLDTADRQTGTAASSASSAGSGAATGGSAGWLQWAILAVLLAIAGLLAALVFKRHGNSAALALLLTSVVWTSAGLPTKAHAAEPDKDKDTLAPPSDPAPAPNPFDTAKPPPPGLPEGVPDPFATAKPDAEPPNPFDIPKDAKPAEVEGDDTLDDRPKETVPDGSDKPGDLSSSGDKDTSVPPEDEGPAPAGDYRDRIEAAEQRVRELSEQTARNQRELADLRLLIESDRNNEPKPDNAPPLPLSCQPPRARKVGDIQIEAAEGDWSAYEQCQACYQQPLTDLERQLGLYEQLRILYANTRDFVTKAIDLGDKIPKPHAMHEAAWAAQKIKIRGAFDDTKKAYDSKLIEFNDKLATLLDQVGECEARHNNNPMWRATTGMIFEKTITVSYTRKD